MKNFSWTYYAGFFWLYLLIFTLPFVYAQQDVRIGVGSITMNINQINASSQVRTIEFPREYTVYTQLTQGWSMGCVYGGGFLIASRDFETRLYFDSFKNEWLFAAQDTVVPFFVSEATSRFYTETAHSTVPVPGGVKRFWKYKAPLRIVNNVNYSDPDWEVFDQVGGPDLIAEQILVSTCNTASGITLTQRAYSFGVPQYDDFILVEYIFKNTGNIDSDPDIEKPNNRAPGTYLALKFIPQPSGLSGRIINGAAGWNAQVDDWLDYFSGEFNGEKIRIMYGWDGDAASSYYPNDDEGDPLPASGIFMSPQYPGMAILHADEAVGNQVNNPDLPLMSFYSFGGATPNQLLSIGLSGVGAEKIYETLSTPDFFTGFFDWEAWNLNSAEVWKEDNNPNKEHFKVGTMGFGPYDFNALGDSVRIVACFAVGSMGWENAVTVGQQWKNGSISQTDKNVRLRSGRDSLFTKISKISSLFRNTGGNFDLNKGANLIGDMPEPPGLILSNSIRAINLEFTDVGAEKYRIYRRLKPEFYLEDPPDELLKKPYSLIKELRPIEIQRTDSGMLNWQDESVAIGVNYWYSVTAVNEQGIESSKFLNRTDPTVGASTKGSAVAMQDAATSLDRVFVVPNPFHIKSQPLYNLPDDELLHFFGLPAQCRIRIYTQSGDLVTTIQHELQIPPEDIEGWNLMTEDGQFIASGLYIFMIDSCTDGEGKELGATKVGKFVVIR